MTCKFDGGVCRVGSVRWWNVKLIWIETQRQRGWANREAVTEAAQPATPATLVGQRQSFDRLSSNQHQGTSPCRPIHQSLWQQHQGLQDRLLLHQLVSSSVLASRSHLSNSAMCVCVCVWQVAVSAQSGQIRARRYPAGFVHAHHFRLRLDQEGQDQLAGSQRWDQRRQNRPLRAHHGPQESQSVAQDITCHR